MMRPRLQTSGFQAIAVNSPLMKLWPAESDTQNVGGFIVEFDSGVRKQVAWRTGAPIEPTLEAAKQFAAKLITDLLADRCMSEVEFTNWASATAAIQKIIVDWNEKVRARLYASNAPTVQ